MPFDFCNLVLGICIYDKGLLDQWVLLIDVKSSINRLKIQ